MNFPCSHPCATELVDYFNRSYSTQIAGHRDTYYFVKITHSQADMESELLAARLASPFLNIPEIFVPDAVVRRRIDLVLKTKEMGEVETENLCVHFVRLCQDYTPRVLPINDLTQAIAAEVAFSTWINRRDAHNSNRVYVSGIPMFFDFGAAFEDSVDFFKGGPDSGYVANWRLWKIPKGKMIVTNDIRDRERGKPLTLHPIEDETLFWAHIDAYQNGWQTLDEGFISATVSQTISDRHRADAITHFLISEKKKLRDKLDVLQRIMTISEQ
jgi:hypothetical protein